MLAIDFLATAATSGFGIAGELLEQIQAPSHAILGKIINGGDLAAASVPASRVMAIASCNEVTTEGSFSTASRPSKIGK